MRARISRLVIAPPTTARNSHRGRLWSCVPAGVVVGWVRSGHARRDGRACGSASIVPPVRVVEVEVPLDLVEATVLQLVALVGVVGAVAEDGDVLVDLTHLARRGLVTRRRGGRRGGWVGC